MNYVADDVEAIAEALKKLEAAKREVLERPIEDDNPTNSPMFGIGNELPSDVEPCAWQDPPDDKVSTFGITWGKIRENIRRQLDEPEPVSIYGDPFWDALIRNGVVKVVEA